MVAIKTDQSVTCSHCQNKQTRSQSSGTSRKGLDLSFLNVFLKTPGGELNRKQISFDFKATWWFFHFETDSLRGSQSTVSEGGKTFTSICCNSPFVTKKLTGVGKGNVTRNVPNSADFMASNKIYAVFHVFGCFKFKVTFHNVFFFKWVLISLLI